jgi:hypothetical protein
MARPFARRLRDAADHTVETIVTLTAAEIPALRRALRAEIARRCLAALLVEHDPPLAPDVARDLDRAVTRLADLVRDLAGPSAPGA